MTVMRHSGLIVEAWALFRRAHGSPVRRAQSHSRTRSGLLSPAIRSRHSGTMATWRIATTPPSPADDSDWRVITLHLTTDASFFNPHDHNIPSQQAHPSAAIIRHSLPSLLSLSLSDHPPHCSNHHGMPPPRCPPPCPPDSLPPSLSLHVHHHLQLHHHLRQLQLPLPG